MADIWRGRLCSYQGRSYGHKTNDITFVVMVETRFTVRSQQKS
ncbi:hypothetical protein [Vallitalea maricola]